MEPKNVRTFGQHDFQERPIILQLIVQILAVQKLHTISIQWIIIVALLSIKYEWDRLDECHRALSSSWVVTCVVSGLLELGLGLDKSRDTEELKIRKSDRNVFCN